MKRASQKVTDANRKEVFAARSDFITASHDPSFVYQLGMTQAAVNQKLRSWAAYPANAAKISNNLKKGLLYRIRSMIFVEEIRNGKKSLAAQSISKTSRTFNVQSILAAPELYAHSDPGSIQIVDVRNEIVNNNCKLYTRNGNAKAVEKLQEVIKNIEYELSNSSQPIDLTSEFADISSGTIIEQDIEDRLNSLISHAYDTATTPIQIQVIGKHKRHIATSNVPLKGTKEARHNTAVYALELIINNAERDDVRTAAEGAVDLTHNTSKKTLARRQKVDSYVYFNSPIVINGQNYNVELATEKIKGQDPDLLDLYNIRVKKAPYQTQLYTLLPWQTLTTIL